LIYFENIYYSFYQFSRC